MVINIGKGTARKADEVIEQAITYFGPDGAGLEVRECRNGFVRFVGGGGYVVVQTREKRGHGSEVDLEGDHSWVPEVETFIAQI